MIFFVNNRVGAFLNYKLVATVYLSIFAFTISIVTFPAIYYVLERLSFNLPFWNLCLQDAFRAGQQFAKKLTEQVSSFESTYEDRNHAEVHPAASNDANSRLQPIQSNKAMATLASEAKTAAIQSSILSIQTDNADNNYEKCDNYCNLESNSDVTTTVDLSTTICDQNSHIKDEIVKTQTTNNLLNLIVRLTRASINFNVLNKSKDDLNALKQNGKTIKI